MIQKAPTAAQRRHALLVRLLARHIEEQEAAYYRIVAENECLRVENEDLRAEAHVGCSCKAAGAPPRLRSLAREG